MMRGMLLLVVWLASVNLFSQTPAERTPEDVVRLWFERWNGLDGTEESANRLLELYLPDAVHQTGPTERQRGTVRYEGTAAIRKMIEEFARTHAEISFRVQVVSAQEASAEIVHLGQGPWGGTSAAVEYAAAFTTRRDQRRWMVPGAAFFQIQGGKIRSVRLYEARDEKMEVFSR